jgi:hypothetical protein
VARLCKARKWAMALTGFATCCCFAPAHAADLTGFAPSYSGQQVMLYVSLSFAGHGSHGQAFGFRYERSSPVSNDPEARFCAPLAHRSLVDLQFARGAGPRMQFGPRVTWDISRGRLAPTNLVNATRMTMSPATPAAMAAWVP